MHTGNVRNAQVSVMAMAMAGVLASFTGIAGARLLAPIDALAQSPAAAVATTTSAATAPQVDPRHRVPTFLSGDAARDSLKAQALVPSRKSGLDPESTARAHLRDLAGVYGISADEINALPIHNVQRLDGGGTIVRFRGTIDGVEVFREQANVLLDRNGELAAIGGFVMGAADARQ